MSTFNQFTQIEPSRRQEPRRDASPQDRSAHRKYLSARHQIGELHFRLDNAELYAPHLVADLTQELKRLTQEVDDYERSQDAAVDKYRRQLMAGELRARQERLRAALHQVHRCELEWEELRQELGAEC